MDGVEVGTQVIVDLYQRVLDGFGMSTEWVVSIVVPIFKGIGDTKLVLSLWASGA